MTNQGHNIFFTSLALDANPAGGAESHVPKILSTPTPVTQITFPVLIAFFIVASVASLVVFVLSAEIKWVRPDLTDRIRKPWLFSGYVTSLLEISRELVAGDSGETYRRVRTLSRTLRALLGIEWALLAACFVLLLLHSG